MHAHTYTHAHASTGHRARQRRRQHGQSAATRVKWASEWITGSFNLVFVFVRVYAYECISMRMCAYLCACACVCMCVLACMELLCSLTLTARVHKSVSWLMLLRQCRLWICWGNLLCLLRCMIIWLRLMIIPDCVFCVVWSIVLRCMIIWRLFLPNPHLRATLASASLQLIRDLTHFTNARTVCVHVHVHVITTTHAKSCHSHVRIICFAMICINAWLSVTFIFSVFASKLSCARKFA